MASNESAPNIFPADETAEMDNSAETLLRVDYGVAEESKYPGHSEDRAVCDEEHMLYGAIDGMGSYGGGDIAAQVLHDSSIAFIAEHHGEFTPDNGADMMRALFKAGIEAVEQRAATEDHLKQMGAVLAMGHLFEHDGKRYAALGVVGDAKSIVKQEGERARESVEENDTTPGHEHEVYNAIQPGFETELPLYF